MDKKDIPDWAWQRAADLTTEKRPADFERFTVDRIKPNYIGQALAAYIAEHEKPPVDPDLLRAREIAAVAFGASGYHDTARSLRKGNIDEQPAVKAVLMAIKEMKK